MGGTFSAGGLISGIDSNTLIQQLVMLQRQPIFRIEDRISVLDLQQDAVKEIRTQMTTLRNRVQDFRFGTIFSAFQTASSEETAMTAEVSSPNPVTGSFEIDVTQLATATSAESGGVLGAAIDPNAVLDSSGITTDVSAGTFTINGVALTVDPATQSLNNVLATINASAAGVTATYDGASDTVTLENTTPGDTSVINFGASGDDSNFLNVLSVTNATQSTGAGGSTEVTSTRHLGAIDASELLTNTSFANGAVTSESFTINGISVSVDPTSDSLSDIIARINDSDADVTASYDSSSDTIRIVSDTLGSRTVNFGTGGTNNFLSVTNLTDLTAAQTAGKDSQFTVNGGPVQTRNTNEVADAIDGVTVSMLSTGTSTVTVSSDNDAIVEHVQEFITEYNATLSMIHEQTGSEGTLSNDSGMRTVQFFLRTNVFDQVTGLAGDFTSLLDIGISTGEEFDATALPLLELDEDAFREALRNDRENVEGLFTNTAENGIADGLYEYLDEATRTTGFLNARAKSNGTIDKQIETLNSQIDRMEDRALQYENRLRRQFTQLETLTASYQNQAAALSSLGAF